MNPSEKLALTTKTFDAEYLLQILGPDGTVLVTVGTPAGDGNVTQFCVWEGEGVNEDGEESDTYVTISAAGSRVGLASDNVEGAWQHAVREGFRLALDTLCKAALSGA